MIKSMPEKYLVELVLKALEPFKTREVKRVVNKADPTEVEILDYEVGMVYGFVNQHLSTPPSENVKVRVVNSFGSEFTITTSIGRVTAYFDPSEGKQGKWFRVDEDFHAVLHRIVLEGEKPLDLSQDEEEEYPPDDLLLMMGESHLNG